MDSISKILEQELLKHVVMKSHMLSEAAEPEYKVGDQLTAWIQGGAPSKYKIEGIAYIKVPIGDLKKGDPIYIAKKGNKTFYLTNADMRDPANEGIDEGVWSKSALAAFRRKPMPGRYFISDETGAILIRGLKTQASVRAYFHDRARDNGYLGGKTPKVVNIHDGKKNNEVVSQYYWKGRGGIDIDNPTAGSYDKIDPKLVKYDEIEKQLGLKESMINEIDVVAWWPVIWSIMPHALQLFGYGVNRLGAAVNKAGRIVKQYLKDRSAVGQTMVALWKKAMDNQELRKAARGGDMATFEKEWNKTYTKEESDWLGDLMNGKRVQPLNTSNSMNEAKYKRINRNQAQLYEKGLKKQVPSVTFATAATQEGEVKLFVNYTKYTDRAKLKKAGEVLGLTYLSDGRSTNAPSSFGSNGAKPIGGGVLGIQNNWMKFAKANNNLSAAEKANVFVR